MAKHHLFVEFDYDFELLAICTKAKDYKLCWSLNNKLGYGFKKEDKDIEIIVKGEKFNFPFYSYYCEDTHTSYNLIANKCKGQYLLSEQKQADFFIKITDNFNESLTDFTSRIKQLDFVLMAYEIKLDNLNKKENLIF